MPTTRTVMRQNRNAYEDAKLEFVVRTDTVTNDRGQIVSVSEYTDNNADGTIDMGHVITNTYDASGQLSRIDEWHDYQWDTRKDYIIEKDYEHVRGAVSKIVERYDNNGDGNWDAFHYTDNIVNERGLIVESHRRYDNYHNGRYGADGRIDSTVDIVWQYDNAGNMTFTGTDYTGDGRFEIETTVEFLA